MSDTKPFYTARDVAKETGVADSTVTSWLRDGMFPGVQKVGQTWCIPHDVYKDICSYAVTRAGNRRPLRVRSGFVSGSFAHLKHGHQYRRERLHRGLREAAQRIDRKRIRGSDVDAA